MAQQLIDGGLSPAEIDLVILSHVHYDHHGDPEDFPKAQFQIGHGAMDVLKHGLGGIASHQHFVPDTLPDDRSSELSDPESWPSLGPFPHVLDLFGDGSVFVVDTPGHLPGHVNLLCRTKQRWIMLCGDAFHDRRLLTGEKEIGTWELEHEGEKHVCCIHVDEGQARESIRRLREFDEMTGRECELIAAHEVRRTRQALTCLGCLLTYELCRRIGGRSIRIRYFLGRFRSCLKVVSVKCHKQMPETVSFNFADSIFAYLAVLPDLVCNPK